MRLPSAIVVIIAAVAISVGAQTKAKKTPAPKTLTLTGCVDEDASTKALTIEDEKEGSYRLSGLNVRDFLGQRVVLAGSVYESKKLVIKGGLVPSPNAAGQAGAIDQTQIANETHGGSAPTGDVQLPEFRVKSIRPLGTGCK